MTKHPAAVTQGDMPRPSRNWTQLALRIPSELMTEAEEIAELLSQPGMPASKSDAFRNAIVRGFEAIRAEHATKPAKKAAKK